MEVQSQGCGLPFEFLFDFLLQMAKHQTNLSKRQFEGGTPAFSNECPRLTVIYRLGWMSKVTDTGTDESNPKKSQPILKF
jgi:hypothetical protein